jgi:hypothetical protein
MEIWKMGYNLIHDVPSVDEIIQRIMMEAKEITLHSSRIFLNEENRKDIE